MKSRNNESHAFLVAFSAIVTTILIISAGCGGPEEVTNTASSEPEAAKPQTTAAQSVETAYLSSLRKLSADARNILDRMEKTMSDATTEGDANVATKEQLISLFNVVADKYVPVLQAYTNEMQSIKQTAEQLTPDVGREGTKTLLIQGLDCYLRGISEEIRSLELMRTNEQGTSYSATGNAQMLYSEGTGYLDQALGE